MGVLEGAKGGCRQVHLLLLLLLQRWERQRHLWEATMRGGPVWWPLRPLSRQWRRQKRH